MGPMLRKVTALGIGMIMLTSLSANAAQSDTYTVKQLVDLAYAEDNNHVTIDRTLEELWKQRNSALEGSKQVQELLDSLSRFRTLYEKKASTLTMEEKLTLDQYKAMFGEKPPEYTGQEMLDEYIKNRDFGHANLLVEYQKLENTKKLILPTFEVNIYKLSVQIVELKETYELQSQYEVIQAKKLAEAKAKYAKGLLSKQEFTKMESEYKILTYQMLQLKNNLESVQFQMNKLIGKDLDTSVNYTNEFLISENYVIKPVTEYVSMALTNRAEILNAKFALETDQMELKTIQTYLQNGLLTDSLTYKNDVIESENNLKLTQSKIEKEIVSLYSEIVKQDQLLKNQSKKYQQELKSFQASKALYSKGLMTKSDYELVTYKFNAAYNNYKTVNRKMGQLLYTLERSTNLGPGTGGN